MASNHHHEENEAEETEVWSGRPKKVDPEGGVVSSWGSTNVNSDEVSPLVKKGDIEGEEEVTDKRGLIISLITLIISIPALIGAWCWPALVIGLLSGTVAAAARSLGHYISFGVTLTLMLCVNGYILYCAVTKRRGLRFQYAPLCLTLIAAVLIMADLSRHVLQDVNIWKSGPFPGSSEYRSGCEQENVSCLTLLGVFFTIICTYSGFIFLFWGTMWNANFLSKLKAIRHKWRKLQSMR